MTVCREVNFFKVKFFRGFLLFGCKHGRVVFQFFVVFYDDVNLVVVGVGDGVDMFVEA